MEKKLIEIKEDKDKNLFEIKVNRITIAFLTWNDIKDLYFDLDELITKNGNYN